MTAMTLASRIVARRRKMVLRSAIPMGAAAFALVIIAAALGSVERQLQVIERTARGGEFVFGEDSDGGLPVDTRLLANIPDALVSHARVSPAVVDTLEESFIGEVWFTDIDAELAFRGVQMEGSTRNSHSAPSGAVVSAAQRWPRSHPPANDTVRVTFPDGTRRTALVAGRTALAEPYPVVLMPWSLLPPLDDADTAARDVVRVRGAAGPLDDSASEMLRSAGWHATDWNARSRERSEDLRALAAALVGLLYIAGGAGMAPAIAIIVRRYRAEFALITSTGYPPHFVSRVIAWSGAIGSAGGALIGSAVAVLLVAVAALRGPVDPSFLPLYWLAENPSLGSLVVKPQIIPAVVAVAGAALCGAVAALPSARLVGTIPIRTIT